MFETTQVRAMRFANGVMQHKAGFPANATHATNSRIYELTKLRT